MPNLVVGLRKVDSYLNVWSPVGRIVSRGVEGVALLESLGQLEWALRFQKDMPSPSGLQVWCKFSATATGPCLCACCHAPMAWSWCHDGHGLALSNSNSQWILSSVSCHGYGDSSQQQKNNYDINFYSVLKEISNKYLPWRTSMWPEASKKFGSPNRNINRFVKEGKRTAVGHAGDMTTSFRTHGMQPIGYYSHDGCTSAACSFTPYCL